MTFVPLCRHLSREIDNTGKNEMLMFDLWHLGWTWICVNLYFSHNNIQWTEEKFA